jgi:hypothetical protein
VVLPNAGFVPSSVRRSGGDPKSGQTSEPIAATDIGYVILEMNWVIIPARKLDGFARDTGLDTLASDLSKRFPL